MKMILDFSLPIEPFNTLVRKGTAGQKVQEVVSAIKPEAVYFTAREGKRGGIMIVDVPDPSKLPALAEPLFLTFDASVQFHPFMTPEDLAKSGLDDLGKRFA
jgi:hypothetical protein